MPKSFTERITSYTRNRYYIIRASEDFTLIVIHNLDHIFASNVRACSSYHVIDSQHPVKNLQIKVRTRRTYLNSVYCPGPRKLPRRVPKRGSKFNTLHPFPFLTTVCAARPPAVRERPPRLPRGLISGGGPCLPSSAEA